MVVARLLGLKANPMKKSKLLFLTALLLTPLCGCSSGQSGSTPTDSKEYIGIVSAMDNEISLLLKEAKIENTVTYGGVEYHAGTLNGKNVVICRSGIGKILAAGAVDSLIGHFNITKTLFTGIAGGIRDEQKVLDQVIATRVCQHDYGKLGNDGFEWLAGDPGMGGMPGEYYPCDAKLVELAYNCAVEVLGKKHVWKGTIASGDQFVASESYVDYLELTHDAYACDMESAAIAVVCQKYDKPFAILRALSDKADGHAHEAYQDFGDVAAENCNRIVLKMLESF